MYKITNYIETELAAGNTVNNKQIRKICEQNGIDLDNHTGAVKESVEIGLMHVARDIAQRNYTTRQKYDRLIDIYNRQPYVGTVRTLNQMIKQQYSTPLPIAFLMSEFVKSKSNEALYFEPSAGNGFLTVALPQRDTICNEIDKFRLDNLCNEHYRKVTNQDGREKFEYGRIFDGVVTNPPFIKEIDTMIFNALDCMKDNGRCAILRDGNNMFQDYYGTKHRSKFVGFYDRLLTEYNVVKIININSKKIYAKQGTAFFMHIILIDGRRSTPNDTPKNRVFNPEIDKIELAGFEELWEYFSPYLYSVNKDNQAQTVELLAKEMQLIMPYKRGDIFKITEKNKDWLSNEKSKEHIFSIPYVTKDGKIGLLDEESFITEKYTYNEFEQFRKENNLEYLYNMANYGRRTGTSSSYIKCRVGDYYKPNLRKKNDRSFYKIIDNSNNVITVIDEQNKKYYFSHEDFLKFCSDNDLEYSHNSNYFDGLISGLDGLTAEQWQNFLAQKEDWISLNIKYSETEYHNNVITIQKPTASFANYRGGEDGYIHYWFHCKKDEIDEKIKVIDKVFNIIIDEFPDWKTENPIISYRPRKDTYHEGYYSVIRELRFTKKENEKFLQVIPFFLKMLAITHEQIHFNTEYVKTLKYCKFQTVAEKVSELAIKEMDLLKLISLDERIRLNFSDAPEKVVKNLISNSWIIATQDEIRKHLQAINIKDVMWDLLANGNYSKETANYIKTKGKDPKDKRMPKWVNIIYSYLCDKYGVKQRVE